MNVKVLSTHCRHPARTGNPTCFVLHTTGADHLDEVLKYYQESSEGISPHYVIDCAGQVYQMVPDEQVAYHCGHGAQAEKLYPQGWDVWSRWAGKPLAQLGDTYSGYLWWRERWPGKESPLELVTGAHPNGVSLGIEMLASVHHQPEVFTDAQYVACAALLAVKAEQYDIPLDKEHVLGHADVAPTNRCDSKGPTDPGQSFNYDRMIQAAACPPVA